MLLPTTYAQAKAARDALEAAADSAYKALNALSGGGASDENKTPEWRAARSAYARAHQMRQTYSKKFVRVYQTETRAEQARRWPA